MQHSTIHFLLTLLVCSILVSGLSKTSANVRNGTFSDNPDEITSLPYLATSPSFKQYSGYLNASSDGTDLQLHYWFVESQNNPSTDPLLLWLNGGPGCSSLDGLLSELGPFHVVNSGSSLSLQYNPYSWNKFANVLFLESPAGVGFSYSVSKNLTCNDDTIAAENFQALLSFFLKYPQFKKNPFFLAGESYAGYYVPLLGLQILDNGKGEINLKGLVIGNGFYNSSTNDNAQIYFAYYHGIIGDVLWKQLQDSCCSENICVFHNNPSQQCRNYVAKAYHFIYYIGLNTYSIYMDCHGGIGGSALKRYKFGMEGVTGRKWTDEPKIRLSQESKLFKPIHQMFAISKGLNCINTTAETIYLQDPKVREALHIPKSVSEWSICSEDITTNYTRNYVDGMLPQFQTLLKNYPILMYNGDVDIECPFNSATLFIDLLGRKELKPRRPWVCNDQIAGFVHEMDGLTVMTIKGAGHMVPQWKPVQAFQMISNFIKGSPQ